jgi:hypothetical protein
MGYLRRYLRNNAAELSCQFATWAQVNAACPKYPERQLYHFDLAASRDSGAR